MITARGWWLLVTVGVLLAAGMAGGVPNVPWLGGGIGSVGSYPIPSVMLIALAVLAWFLGSLLLFAVRLRLLHGRLSVVRQLYDDQGPVPSLWAEHTYRVRL